MSEAVTLNNLSKTDFKESNNMEEIKNQKRRHSSWLENGFFLLIFSVIAYGWLIREEELFSAEVGWGYWLGIIGGSLMLILMLYPLRKHVKRMRNWGPIRIWFRFHMMFGVLGPIAVLYHANFSLGSVNSNVALFAMITVAASGLIGRYFYSKIHNGLYGKKASLTGLQDAIESSGKVLTSHEINTAELLSQLEGFEHRLLNRANNLLTGALMLPFLSLYSFIFSRRLLVQMHNAITKNNVPNLEANALRRDIKKKVISYLRAVVKVFEYKIYERIFSLWHVLHLPLFIIMLCTGLFHVYAVHMY